MIQCTKCGALNDADAKFCKNCGTSFYTLPEKRGKISDVLIVIFLALNIVIGLSHMLIQRFIPDWYHGVTMFIFAGLSIVGAVSYLLLGFAIKDVPLKIIGIVLAGIVVIRALVGNITWIFNAF